MNAHGEMVLTAETRRGLGKVLMTRLAVLAGIAALALTGCGEGNATGPVPTFGTGRDLERADKLARAIAQRRLSVDYPGQHVYAIQEALSFTKKLLFARAAAVVGFPAPRDLGREANVTIGHEGHALMLVSYSEHPRKAR
jgi:hypothetical protein